MDTELSSEQTEHILSGITIPPCPASLTAILREAKNPSADLASLAHLIGRDAGLVAPLLKLANSPFVGLKNKATSVLSAVSVLGMQKTLNLVQNIALRQSMSSNTHNFEEFWDRSSLMASIAEIVAKKVGVISKDDAYLAALFHDCGIPVLMMKFPEYRETVLAQARSESAICNIENKFFNTSHPVVGNMLTRNWKLPANISKAILYHHDATIFEASAHIEADVRRLIGVIHIAECIAEESLHQQHQEWEQFAQPVLKNFDMSEQEFLDLKADVLHYLDGE